MESKQQKKVQFSGIFASLLLMIFSPLNFFFYFRLNRETFSKLFHQSFIFRFFLRRIFRILNRDDIFLDRQSQSVNIRKSNFFGLMEIF